MDILLINVSVKFPFLFSMCLLGSFDVEESKLPNSGNRSSRNNVSVG